MTDTWKHALNDIAGHLLPGTLPAVAVELESGGMRLIHHEWTYPPPRAGLNGRECASGCLLCFMAMQEGCATIADALKWYYRLQEKVGSAKTSAVLRKWDLEVTAENEAETRREVLAEVRMILARKERAA